MQSKFKMLILSISLVAFTAPAMAADYVMVRYAGQERKIRDINVKELSVCSFKRMVASEFGLNMDKFDLVYHGSTLKDGKTLDGSGVRHSNMVDVKDTNHSFQC